ALAQSPASAPAEAERVAAIVGSAEAWGALPLWRQRMVLQRHREFLALPPGRRAEIERGGLQEFLLHASRRADAGSLPPELREELRSLPPAARATAVKLAFLRWRELHLDDALRRLPTAAERRAMFLRLFPEPFDPAAARAAHHELREKVKAIVTRALRPRLLEREKAAGRPFTGEERRAAARELLDEEAGAEKERVLRRIRRELLRAGAADPAALDRRGAHLIERARIFATPRERELIRYAFAPRDCPFLDLGFLGPPPREAAERREWERDFRILARLDLLAEAGLPREMLLHLVETGSPEDFLRAFKSLRGLRPGGPPGGR
ncbi:MAG: hypothetical protein ACREID_09510, partial [Planctomycetota bacterium]